MLPLSSIVKKKLAMWLTICRVGIIALANVTGLPAELLLPAVIGYKFSFLFSLACFFSGKQEYFDGDWITVLIMGVELAVLLMGVLFYLSFAGFGGFRL